MEQEIRGETKEKVTREVGQETCGGEGGGRAGRVRAGRTGWTSGGGDHVGPVLPAVEELCSLCLWPLLGSGWSAGVHGSAVTTTHSSLFCWRLTFLDQLATEASWEEMSSTAAVWTHQFPKLLACSRLSLLRSEVTRI